MGEECKAQIAAHGNWLATLDERVNTHSDRIRELHAEKLDRREIAVLKWVGMTAGSGVILLIIGALGKLLLKP